MSYNASIPQAGDLISVSQSQILSNFDQLNQKWTVDHYGLDPSTANDGKHKQVTLPVLGSAPTTSANEGALYAKLVSGVAQLYYRLASNGTELPISGGGLVTVGNDNAVEFAGIKLKWGVATIPANSNTMVTFAGNAFTSSSSYVALVSFQDNPADPESVCYTVTRTTTTMLIANGIRTGLTLPYSYFCIGT